MLNVRCIGSGSAVDPSSSIRNCTAVTGGFIGKTAKTAAAAFITAMGTCTTFF